MSSARLLTHLVSGAAGQDGILLTRRLLAAGHRVVACVAPGAAPSALLDGAEVVEHDVRDTDAFATLLTRTGADVVHNLAALSSVAACWEDPAASQEINQDAVLGMLDVLRGHDRAVTFVQASSADIVGAGDGPGSTVTEDTPLAPVSPYAEHKAAAHRAVRTARADGHRATNLILFGHTSVLHAPRFVLPRITTQVAQLARAGGDTVWLQAPGVRRDWGAAGDFVRAFALAASATPGDFVIGTGDLLDLREIAGWALARAGVEARVARPEDAPERPHDFDGLRADASRAAGVLGWRPAITLRAEIERMVDIELRRAGTDRTLDDVAEELDAGPRC